MQSDKNWSYRIPTGGGDNFNKLGQSVSVEAQTTIDKGDKIVGIKNDSTAPKFSISSAGVGIYALSLDESVGIGYVEKIVAGTTIPICFLNESGTYDRYNLIIETLPEGFSEITKQPVINNDGTLAISSVFIDEGDTTSYKNTNLVIEINKDKKSAEYSFVETTFTDIVTNSNNYTCTIDSPDISFDSAILANRYLFSRAKAHIIDKNTGEYYYVKNALVVLKYNGIKFELVYNEEIIASQTASADYIPSGTNAAIIDDTIITSVYSKRNRYIIKFSTKNNILYMSNMINIPSTYINSLYFSKNGRYLTVIAESSTSKKPRICSLNVTDLTITSIKEFFSAYTIFVNDDGNLIYASGVGCIYQPTESSFNAIGSFTSSDGQTIPANKSFTSNRIINQATNKTSMIAAVTPSTNAEYLISKTESLTIESDKMYGIASENLTAGIKGTAQKLFGV